MPAQTRTRAAAACAAFVILTAVPAAAQTLGTFRWQLTPYCNVLTFTVVASGDHFLLDGYDDQCGATTRASATGVAFFNPDGTIGFGVTIVTTPGGRAEHVDATADYANNVSGTWRDDAGRTGGWILTTGPGTGPSRTAPTRRLRINAYSALARDGDPSVTNFGCGIFNPAQTSRIFMDLPLPSRATIVQVVFKYRDTSQESGMQASIRRLEFLDANGAINDTAVLNMLTDNSGPQGNRIDARTPTSPLQVSDTISYYLSANAPAHTGDIWFCGLDIVYVP